MVRPRAAVCGPCRHRIHVLLALVGRHLLSSARHHHLAVPGAGRRTVGGGAGGSWLEAWRGFSRQLGGRGRGRGCAAHAIWQHVRTADDCHGPRFAGHV